VSWRAKVPKALAVGLTVLAVFCAVAAVSAAFVERTQWVRVAIDNLLVPAPPNLGYAAFVGVLAAGVNNRKRVAYWMLIVYFGLQLLGDLALFVVLMLPPSLWTDERPPWFAAWLIAGNLVLTGGVLLVLGLSRAQFYAKVQRASLRKALLTLIGLVVLFGILGWALVEAFPGSLRRGARSAEIASSPGEPRGRSHTRTPAATSAAAASSQPRPLDATRARRFGAGGAALEPAASALAPASREALSTRWSNWASGCSSRAAANSFASSSASGSSFMAGSQRTGCDHGGLATTRERRRGRGASARRRCPMVSPPAPRSRPA